MKQFESISLRRRITAVALKGRDKVSIRVWHYLGQSSLLGGAGLNVSAVRRLHKWLGEWLKEHEGRRP